MQDTIKKKIANYTNNQENHTLNEKRQSTDANIEMNQIKLSGKEFKATIIKMLPQSIISSFETNENM